MVVKVADFRANAGKAERLSPYEIRIPLKASADPAVNALHVKEVRGLDAVIVHTADDFAAVSEAVAGDGVAVYNDMGRVGPSDNDVLMGRKKALQTDRIMLKDILKGATEQGFKGLNTKLAAAVLMEKADKEPKMRPFVTNLTQVGAKNAQTGFNSNIRAREMDPKGRKGA